MPISKNSRDAILKAATKNGKSINNINVIMKAFKDALEESGEIILSEDEVTSIRSIILQQGKKEVKGELLCDFCSSIVDSRKKKPKEPEGWSTLGTPDPNDSLRSKVSNGWIKIGDSLDEDWLEEDEYRDVQHKASDYKKQGSAGDDGWVKVDNEADSNVACKPDGANCLTGGSNMFRSKHAAAEAAKRKNIRERIFQK